LGSGTFTIASPNSNTDRTLNLPDASGTFLMEGASQSPTFGTVTATTTNTTSLAVNGNNISAVNSLGFRNRIINGNMVIDQRNNGASLALTNTERFPVDRFQVRSDATGVSGTIQQSTLAPAGFNNSLLISITTGGTIGSTDRGFLVQNIEGFNLADLGFGTASASAITLSFWVRSSLTGTFSGALQNSAQTRAYVYTFPINAANTWEYKTITISGETSGTWVTNNGNGMRVFFDIGNGSALRTSSTGSWQTSDFRGATGAVSLAANSGATFYITGVQLEAGSVATPFEQIDYGRELMMCQRYCYVIGRNSAYEPVGYGFAITTGAVDFLVALPVVMRTVPSLGTSGSAQISDGANNFVVFVLSILGVQSGTQQLQLRATTSGLTQFRPYRVESNNNTTTLSIFSAEL
jgi:hypothetical protein